MQKGEECDDGNVSNADDCLTTCLKASCGDGFKGPGEECDDGNFSNADACTNGCKLAKCGDGFVHKGVEACDDGNEDDADGCTGKCALPSCGDGNLQKGEQCDDGNPSNADGCLTTCLKASCGDGFVQKGVEECDDGNADVTDACLASCKLAKCGDGFVRQGVEACDDGNQNDGDGCSNACKLESCGDGVVQAPEQCDDGNASSADGCLGTCFKAFCGDGFVHQGVEACDDANQNDADGCTSGCALTGCGDGIVQVPEQCDDGNASNADGCLVTCLKAACGDGFVWAGVEQCDDANGESTDACLPGCQKASCGDGLVWAGVEQCDDGNGDDADGCLASCQKASCGDGFVWAGVEQCDDANNDNTDGCLMTCESFDLCEGFGIAGVQPPVACKGKSPKDLELAASGLGFLKVEGQAPAVTFAGAPAPVLSMKGCAAVGGLLQSVQACSSMVIDIPDNLAEGVYAIGVENAITQKCPAAATFSVAPPPTITSILPAAACGGGTFTITGSNFVPNTQVLFGNVVPDKTVYLGPTKLEVTFAKLPKGQYDVTVSNGPGCETTKPKAVDILPVPMIFFVDPPIVYNGINLQVTIYVTDINGGNVVDVGIRPSQSQQNFKSLQFSYDPKKPHRIVATIPKGLDPIAHDVRIKDALGCTADLFGAFDVTDKLNLALEAIDPPFGWQQDLTGVSLFATEPPPQNQVSFKDLPRAYLSPADPNALATEIRAVNFLTAAEISGVVPEGLKPGLYDVIVVNPDKAVGLLKQAYRVTVQAPPLIDWISPGSIPNKDVQPLGIFGKGFSNPTVKLECKDPNNVVKKIDLVVNGSSATSITTSVAAAGLVQGSVCIVIVTDPDGSFGEFAALGVTAPSENLENPVVEPPMIAKRRALAAASGQATARAHFIYALGGDTGTVSLDGVLDSAEVAPLDRYGRPVAWRGLPTSLPGARTLAKAATIGRFIYLAGGNKGDGVVDTVLRAEILRPTDVPAIVAVDLDVQPKGLTKGIWYYRVAAVMDGADPDNPGGETLPSDGQPIQVPGGLPGELETTITWEAVPGAKTYRIYRSPKANAGAGKEQLLETVAAPATSYTDQGKATTNQSPRRMGDLGEWRQMATLKTKREGLALQAVRDPLPATETWYLYAVGGRDGGAVVQNGYEHVRVNVDQDGGQALAGGWTTGATVFANKARWLLGGFTVDQTATLRVKVDESYVFVVGGINSGGQQKYGDADAARVTFNVNGDGKLGAWSSQSGVNPAQAGMGTMAAANQLFTFGGQNNGPSTQAKSTQICLPACPQLENWNNSVQMNVDRYLLDATVECARVFILGGMTGNGVTNSVESTVW
ncbi:MAG: DUF4215 domain-containing protein [Deltaproteobacteria bacterium]|nr:DUF4215 domain-containing protein [Deltaproteobacteria bacterium]